MVSGMTVWQTAKLVKNSSDWASSLIWFKLELNPWLLLWIVFGSCSFSALSLVSTWSAFNFLPAMEHSLNFMMFWVKVPREKKRLDRDKWPSFRLLLCDNYELSSMTSWVGCLLKDSDLFILFAENSQIHVKISVIPILLTFIYLVALNLLKCTKM